jgi:hypothetical protein
MHAKNEFFVKTATFLFSSFFLLVKKTHISHSRSERERRRRRRRRRRVIIIMATKQQTRKIQIITEQTSRTMVENQLRIGLDVVCYQRGARERFGF